MSSWHYAIFYRIRLRVKMLDHLVIFLKSFFFVILQLFLVRGLCWFLSLDLSLFFKSVRDQWRDLFEKI